MARETPVKPVTSKRRKKKYERNFAGDQSKREGDKSDWVRGCPCDVTGGYPVEAAHLNGARGMGGTGGDATGLVPLAKAVHDDFDGRSLPYLDDEAFKAKHNRTRESIRQRAAFYEQLWQEHGWDGEGLSF